MKFIADENIDRTIVELLRQEKHSVFCVIEMGQGISDDLVIEQANRDEAVIITADKDFGELMFRQERTACGIILLR